MCSLHPSTRDFILAVQFCNYSELALHYLERHMTHVNSHPPHWQMRGPPVSYPEAGPTTPPRPVVPTQAMQTPPPNVAHSPAMQVHSPGISQHPGDSPAQQHPEQQFTVAADEGGRHHAEAAAPPATNAAQHQLVFDI